MDCNVKSNVGTGSIGIRSGVLAELIRKSRELRDASVKILSDPNLGDIGGLLWLLIPISISATGSKIMTTAAQNFEPVTLELDGKSLIVICSTKQDTLELPGLVSALIGRDVNDNLLEANTLEADEGLHAFPLKNILLLNRLTCIYTAGEAEENTLVVVLSFFLE